jgi:hypothetical protein
MVGMGGKKIGLSSTHRICAFITYTMPSSFFCQLLYLFSYDPINEEPALPPFYLFIYFFCVGFGKGMTLISSSPKKKQKIIATNWTLSFQLNPVVSNAHFGSILKVFFPFVIYYSK